MPEERLQKILSQAGVASRRKAEELIREGRVTVNGKWVTELGSKADLDVDHIKVDGNLLHAPKRHTYIALNKPKECMTTVSDPEGRQTVMHLMRGVRERVFPVGRLDYNSEGLLLLTNDGEFAHRITSPSTHITKVYVAKVTGPLTEDQEKIFREGVPMHGRKTAPAELKLIKRGSNPWYEVRLTEGRQNQIRVMFKHFGKLVEKLRRVKIGFLELDLPPGRYRSLTPAEIEKFRRMLKLDESWEEAEPKVKAYTLAKPAADLGPKPEPKPKRTPKAKASFPPKATVKFPAKPKAKAPAKAEFKTRAARPAKFAPRPERSEEFAPRPAGANKFGPKKFGPKPGGKPGFKSAGKPVFKSGGKPPAKSGAKPAFKSGGRPGFKPVRSPKRG
jgi:23S rRNA pseudouridine2605 synthase